jgi:Reverse transcriptase (RNA-dependent DNA polymerase)
MNYREAWDNKCEWQRNRWREAIEKELNKMNQQNVWTVIKRDAMEKGRKCIKYKWVFDIKRDGIFRARLVACGYSQVPGVDFKESYSPVINDIVFRVIIICQIVWNLTAKILDVEVAFLNGDLDETIYMECPDGVKHDNDEVLLLNKSMYGLVQAARQFFIKFSNILKNIGFKQSTAEPCLFYKQMKDHIILMTIHVDDCYIIGKEESINEVIKDIEKEGLKLKVNNETKDYLSCEILFNNEKTKAWIGQPHLIKKIEATYKDYIKNCQSYKTPGTPNYGIVRPKSDDEKVAESNQTMYRSAVGSLLQLVKHSRPDIANPVRELSKCMDGATPAAMKELRRLIKFIIDTKDYGLKIEPNSTNMDEWIVKVYSDSDWGGDKNNRHSVSGYIIFLLGVPILWKSKLQRTVALSSSEAEYYALSESAKDIRFIYQILSSIGIKVTLPIIVHVDNVGAIFMSENVSATSRTKHVDIRYHYVREFIESGFIKIIFVKSGENKSDMFTKNISSNYTIIIRRILL